MFRTDQDRSDFCFGVNITKLDLKNGLSNDYESPMSHHDDNFLNGKNSLISPVASRAQDSALKYSSFEVFCSEQENPY